MTSDAKGGTKLIHFKGFNTLRFYAALSVIVHHVSYSPYDWFGQAPLPVTVERFFLTGTDAVNLFFVLSGFLITYLLLVEHEQRGKVNIRNFYIRRSLRIYPVYYVALFFMYMILRPPYKLELTMLLVFFMGNVAFVRYFPFPPLEHFWSLAVEEQYYFTAPILARFPKQLHKILLSIIGFWLFLLMLTYSSNSRVSRFIAMSRYDLIAFGALLAYYHYHDIPFLRWLRTPVVQFAAYGIIVAAIVFGKTNHNFLYITPVTYACGVLVYNIATEPAWMRRFIYPRIEQLGNFSYSMYIYHQFFVLIFYTLLYKTLPHYAFYIYPIVIGSTLITSWVSYRYLEQPFLRLKSRFKEVQSYPSSEEASRSTLNHS